MGSPLPHLADVQSAARSLVERGISHVVVSLGAEGALFTTQEASVLAVPPAGIQPLSTVGAGDALATGYLAGLIRGLDLSDRARLATAYAVGIIESEQRALPEPEALQTLMERVRVT